MGRVRIVGALGLALLLAGTVAGLAQARSPRARIVGTFAMRGRIVTALRVRGEHRGQIVHRRWTFTGIGCGARSCRRLQLRRERSAGRFDRLTLRPSGAVYTGSGRFFAALECKGRTYARGEVVPYRITVRIAGVNRVQGIPFARRLAATYTNVQRIDRTPCPLGPSHDAARYSGSASPPVGPPGASFTVDVNGATDVAAFTDTSHPGGGGARIVARSWQFGDAASGAANTSTTPNPQHAFSAPGSYEVSLTVRDADGLVATATSTVVAPGPPAAAFAEAATAAPLTDQFQDRSSPGVGGAAIQGWSWSFGDPASGPADTSSDENPQHTFSAPGTYTVTLTVTDANGRTATTAAPVTVSTGP